MDNEGVFNHQNITPCNNFHKQQSLPLRSNWRFPESGALVYGNVEIRRRMAIFWTRINTRFCAVTDRGLLLIYGETEKGLAIDLKALHSVDANIAVKKVNGSQMPRCLLTLRHSCGDKLMMCMRGKTEIAKWRCAISNAMQHTSTHPVEIGESKVSLVVEEDQAPIRVPSPIDPVDIDYWNNPAAGKQMSSPRIYRAVSQHGLMHLSMMNCSSHSNLVHNLSMNCTVASGNEDLSGQRKYRTLPRKSSMRRSAVPSFTVGSFRKRRESPSPECDREVVTEVSSGDVPPKASTSPDPSTDSGLASAVHTPDSKFPDEIDVEVDEAFICSDEAPIRWTGDSKAWCGTDTVLGDPNLEYIPEYMRRTMITLPMLTLENLNIDGIFEEVIQYLNAPICTQA